MIPDYSKPDIVLPFICEFVGTGSPLVDLRARLMMDGSLAFGFLLDGQPTEAVWREKPTGADIEIPLEMGVVCIDPGVEIDLERRERLRKSAALIASRLHRLIRGNAPELLHWRNRNPVTLYYGVRMFVTLCQNLLKKGQTTYYGYTLVRLDESEGLIQISFESREFSVSMMLTLTELLDREPLRVWGPMALVMVEDDRDDAARNDPAHQVEQFLGYVLSRNLPDDFTLAFEGKDPPAGFMPPDFNIDMLNVDPPDSSSLYEMIFATSRDITTVTVCDRECFNMFSFVAAPKENWITNMPWQIVPSPDLFDHVHNVYLSSERTVMGHDNIETCLSDLRTRENKPGMVVFIDSCISRMVGDDLAGPIRRFQKASEIPLVQYEITLSEASYLKTFRDFWKRVYLRAADHSLEPEPGELCLLGIGDDDADGEMTKLLAALDLRAAVRLFPSLKLEETRRIARSSLVVVNAWEYIQVLFSDMLAELKRPTVTVPLPYGFAGTLAFYDSVSRAAGGLGASVLEAHDLVSRAREAFEREKQGIAGGRIGLFLRLRDIAMHLGARGRFGVPLLDVLRELGLGIDLNLFVVAGEKADEVAVMSELGLSADCGDSVSFFDHWRQLPGMLAKDDFGVVYTETFRDQRVTSAGKPMMTLRDLEPGFAGAVRTARRVRLALKNTFYARYGKYLPDPYAHYRSAKGT
jgi:hypothetical protein